MSRKPTYASAVFRQQGFTLIELLVVLAMLVAVAVVATGAFTGVSEHANDRLVRAEMQEIAKAIRQFRQDTGYYPKTGPFDLAAHGGSVPYGSLPSHAGASTAEQDRWFYSPANLHQLLSNTSPLVTTGHQLREWDPETGRGWRGPYLDDQGYVDIRDGINSGTPAGSPAGDPLAGTNIPDVDGIADPFEHRAVTVGANTLLDWSLTEPRPNREELASWGRPYLVFDLDTAPRIVSMGPDGVYDTTDDIELEIN